MRVSRRSFKRILSELSSDNENNDRTPVPPPQKKKKTLKKTFPPSRTGREESAQLCVYVGEEVFVIFIAIVVCICHYHCAMSLSIVVCFVFVIVIVSIALVIAEPLLSALLLHCMNHIWSVISYHRLWNISSLFIQ